MHTFPNEHFILTQTRPGRISVSRTATVLEYRTRVSLCCGGTQFEDDYEFECQLCAGFWVLECKRSSRDIEWTKYIIKSEVQVDGCSDYYCLLREFH
jgi:hypothetical protein